jgi:hypothetical protein
LEEDFPYERRKKVRKYLLSIIGVCGVIFLLAGIVVAQTDKPIEGSDVEDVEFSYGMVNSVSSTQLDLSEYDYDTNQETAVIYVIDENTKVEGADGLKGIVSGDGAEVKYEVKEGKKIAKTITIEKQDAEGEIDREPADAEPNVGLEASEQAIEAQGSTEIGAKATKEEIKIQ